MVKTLEQLLEEIMKSEELKQELTNALGDKSSAEEFLKRNGCDATLEEAGAFLREKAEEMKNSGELTPEQLEQVAGGEMITFLCVWTTVVCAGVVTAGCME